MSEWYSHIDARQIDDVIKAQEAIVGKKQAGGGKPPEKTAAGKGEKKSKGLKIVKMPARKTA
jgi:hypothetical protein